MTGHRINFLCPKSDADAALIRNNHLVPYGIKLRLKCKNRVSSRRGENPEWLKIEYMKRRCKNIDITGVAFIEKSVANFMANRDPQERQRRDIVKLYEKYGNNHAVAIMLRDKFLKAKTTETLNLLPVVTKPHYDTSSHKWREITVEDIERQLFEQIAFDALKDAAKCVGEYQCTCLKNQKKKVIDRKTHQQKIDPETGEPVFKMVGRGQVWAKDAAAGWMTDPKIRVIVQADIRKNYPSVSHRKLFRLLKRKIKNPDLILLIHLLIDEFGPIGLPIGSVLSIILDAIYLSQIYHHMMEDCRRIRKHRNGTSERIRVVKHCLMWMDDIYLYCTSKKNAQIAKAELMRYAKTLDLEIKPSIKIIDKIDPPAHPHIHQAKQSYVDTVGYRVYPDHVTMRNKNYVSAKRNLKKGRKCMTLRLARTLMAQRGTVIHSNSYRFRKKYHTKTVWRNARKVIRNHDKGNVRLTTGCRENNNTGWNDNCAIMPA